MLDPTQLSIIKHKVFECLDLRFVGYGVWGHETGGRCFYSVHHYGRRAAPDEHERKRLRDHGLEWVRAYSTTYVEGGDFYTKTEWIIRETEIGNDKARIRSVPNVRKAYGSNSVFVPTMFIGLFCLLAIIGTCDGAKDPCGMRCGVPIGSLSYAGFQMECAGDVGILQDNIAEITSTGLHCLYNRRLCMGLSEERQLHGKKMWSGDASISGTLGWMCKIIVYFIACVSCLEFCVYIYNKVFIQCSNVKNFNRKSGINHKCTAELLCILALWMSGVNGQNQTTTITTTTTTTTTITSTMSSTTTIVPEPDFPRPPGIFIGGTKTASSNGEIMTLTNLGWGSITQERPPMTVEKKKNTNVWMRPGAPLSTLIPIESIQADVTPQWNGTLGLIVGCSDRFHAVFPSDMSKTYIMAWNSQGMLCTYEFSYDDQLGNSEVYARVLSSERFDQYRGYYDATGLIENCKPTKIPNMYSCGRQPLTINGAVATDEWSIICFALKHQKDVCACAAYYGIGLMRNCKLPVQKGKYCASNNCVIEGSDEWTWVPGHSEVANEGLWDEKIITTKCMKYSGGKFGGVIHEYGAFSWDTTELPDQIRIVGYQSDCKIRIVKKVLDGTEKVIGRLAKDLDQGLSVPLSISQDISVAYGFIDSLGDRPVFFEENYDSWFSRLWPPKKYANVRVGSKFYTVRQDITWCRHYVSWMENYCVAFLRDANAHNYISAGWYVLIWLLTGGTAQLVHLIRWVLSWKDCRYMLKKRSQIYYIQWYNSGNDEMRDLAEKLKDGHEKGLTEMNKGKLKTSLHSQHHWNCDEYKEKMMVFERNMDEMYERWSWYYKAMNYILFVFPQILYAVIIIYSPLFLIFKMFAKVAINQPPPSVSGDEMPNEMKSDVIKSTDYRKKRDLGYIANKYRHVKRKTTNAYKSWKPWKLVCVIWMLIGPVNSVTITYIKNCKGNDCTRSIYLDENIAIQKGSNLEIQLMNPTTKVIDGGINITVVDIDARIVGQYDYSIPTTDVAYWALADDWNDCDGDCSTPWDADEAPGIGDKLDCGKWAKIIEGRNYVWSSTVEFGGNNGYCAGITGLIPDWSGPIARSFRMGSATSTVTIEVSVITPEASFKQTFVTPMGGDSAEIDGLGSISLVAAERPLSRLSSERITCYWPDRQNSTDAFECKKGGEEFNDASLFTKTIGEGDLGFLTWRAPGVKSWWTQESTECTKSDCTCKMYWSTDALVHWNRQDILGLSSLVGQDCSVKVTVGDEKLGEEQEICLANGETLESCPGPDACWKKKVVPKIPSGLAIHSSGCSYSYARVTGDFLMNYIASVDYSYLDHTSLDFMVTGCAGSINGLKFTMDSKLDGTVFLASSDYVQVPQVLTANVGENIFYGSTDYTTNDVKFSVIEKDGPYSVVLTVEIDFCDTYTEGGNGETGAMPPNAIDRSMKWWVKLLIVVGIILLVVLIIVLCLNCGSKDKATTNYITTLSDHKKMV